LKYRADPRSTSQVFGKFRNHPNLPELPDKLKLPPTDGTTGTGTATPNGGTNPRGPPVGLFRRATLSRK